MSFYGELLDSEDKEKEKSSGQQGGMSGLVLGEVKENWDKDHPGMVKVQFLLGEDTKKSKLGWVPIVVPYAGKEFGSYMLPEVGAHVVLAYHMGQPQSAYVLGCLWTQQNTLPKQTANEKNTIKTLRTKGGSQVTISDEKGKEKISVETKGGLRFELEDENQKVSIQDKKVENKILLDAKKGELTFQAKSKLSFQAGKKIVLVLEEGKAELKTENINIKAGQKLHLKGQNTTLEGSSAEVKGQNIKLESQAALSLKGSASLKAESSGIMQLKGTMLKLN